MWSFIGSIIAKERPSEVSLLQLSLPFPLTEMLYMLLICVIEGGYRWLFFIGFQQRQIVYRYNFKITMPAKLLWLLALCLVLAHPQTITSTTTYTSTTSSSSSSSATNSITFYPDLLPCVAYSSGNCVTCPYNYHIAQNQCYLNITGCLVYTITTTGTEQCQQCDPSLGVLISTGTCSFQTNIFSQSASSSTLSAETAAARYGDNRFRIISLQTALLDPYFIILNRYMLAGEYKHFIATSTQPVVSVAFFSVSVQKQYKILYNGSGGGLMMCIIEINTATNAIQINSFVPVGVTNVIDNCGQYDLQMECVECSIGWHLEEDRCFVNIGGCVSYREYICVACFGYAILIENRCVSCVEMADLNKGAFWNGGSLGGEEMPERDHSYLVSG